MSRLSVFLNPAIPAERKEIVVSHRFLDEDGKPVPFTIKALTQAENEELIRMSRHPVKSYVVLNRGLAVGDRVLMLRVERGQKCIVLSRIF